MKSFIRKSTYFYVIDSLKSIIKTIIQIQSLCVVAFIMKSYEYIYKFVGGTIAEN